MDSLVNRNTDMYHYGNKYCFKRNGYEESNYRTNNAYWAAGFSGQFIYVDPSNEIIIVRQGDGENTTWRYLLGRLASLIIDQKNDLTSSQIDKFNLFEGVYVHSEGDTIRVQPQEERDEYNRRCWTFERNTNVNRTHKGKPIFTK